MTKQQTQIKKFVEQFSGAAIDDEELAENAADLLNCDIGKAATKYLEAKDYFFALLEKEGFERG